MAYAHVHDINVEPSRYECGRDPDLWRPLVICRLLEAGESWEDQCIRDLLLLKGDEHTDGILRGCVYKDTHIGGVRKSHSEQHFAACFVDGQRYMLTFPCWLATLDLCEFIAAEVGGFYCPWYPTNFGRPTLWCAWKCKRVEVRFSRRADPDPRSYMGYGKLLVRRTDDFNREALLAFLDPEQRNLREDDVVIQKRNVPLWKKRENADPDDVSVDEDLQAPLIDEIDALPEGPRFDASFDRDIFIDEFYTRRDLPLPTLRKWLSAYMFSINDLVFTVLPGLDIRPLCTLTNLKAQPFTIDKADRNGKKRRMSLSKDLRLAMPTYTCFDMVPNEPVVLPGRRLNRWRGWHLTLEGELVQRPQHPLDVHLFRMFMAELCQRLFNSDLSLFYTGLAFMRHAYLSPEECPHRMLLFHGVHGIGKGAFIDHFLGRHIFGHHFLSLNCVSRLTQTFNSALLNACVIHLDDVVMSTPQYQQIKSVITQTSSSVEFKGVDRIKVDHLVHHIFMSCNKIDFACDISERRLLMIQCGDTLSNALQLGNKALWNSTNRAFFDMCTSMHEAPQIAALFIRFLVYYLNPQEYDTDRSPPSTLLLRKTAIKSLPRHLEIWFNALCENQNIDYEMRRTLRDAWTEKRTRKERDPENAFAWITVEDEPLEHEAEYELEGMWFRRVPWKTFKDWMYGNSHNLPDTSWFHGYGLSFSYVDGKRMVCIPAHGDAVQMARQHYPAMDFQYHIARKIPVWNRYEGMPHHDMLDLRPMDEFVAALKTRCVPERIDIDT